LIFKNTELCPFLCQSVQFQETRNDADSKFMFILKSLLQAH
jgi:hypothetical protein